MNGIEAVRACLVDHLGECACAPFTDALTHVHGTVGFSHLVGDSLRTVAFAHTSLDSEAVATLRPGR